MFARQTLPSIKQAKQSFAPDFIASSVAAIDFPFLRARGIKACFIDLDGTVVSRGTHDVAPAVKLVLKNAELPIYIATNRPRSRELKNLKADLSAAAVIHPRGIYAKPSKRYYAAALAEHDLKSHEVVMIGDRYIQDIFGANRAGLYSLVVEKSGASIGRLDKLLSKAEANATRLFMGRYRQLD